MLDMSFAAGFPMKKVDGQDDLWEIILLPVVSGKTARDCNSDDDKNISDVRVGLNLEDGVIILSKEVYHFKFGEEITITPEFIKEKFS
jgi:hypothetical protein